jgi:hypothetical protein
MYDYGEDIERIKNPEHIREAVYASSPYVLMRAFENDLTVQRLINAGQEVVPLIAKELENTGLELPEITLACFAYILQRVDLESAVRILKPSFAQATEKPGPFFVHFAAHAIRQDRELPIKPLEMVYSEAELFEALEPRKPQRR